MILEIIEGFIDRNPERFEELFLKQVKKRPEMWLKILVTALEHTPERNLIRHQRAFQRLLKIALGEEFWNDLQKTIRSHKKSSA